MPDMDGVSLLPTQESVLITFGSITGGTKSGIKPTLFSADDPETGALSAGVDMARGCIG